VREGLSFANNAGDDSSVGYYLQRLSGLAQLQGDPERAVCLLAVADSLLQRSGSGWLLAYLAACPSSQDAEAELRRQLDDDTFERTWQRGAAMGRQDAVALALQT